jgi:hypothetical protein
VTALEDVVAELYALPPEDFTAARDAAAKAAGQPVRKEIQGLRRPTVSAWLVNRLAREQADLLEQLLQLGPALAEAQAARSGSDLRELGQQRRELVQAVTTTAVDAAGRDVSATVRGEVEQTLEAALADPAAADAVRSGALVRPLSFAGFGGVDVEGAVAVAAPAPRPARTRSAPDRPAAKDRAVTSAEAAALEAAATLDDAVRACETAETDRAAAADEVTRAEAERDAAQQVVTDLEQQLTDARRAVDESGHRVSEARRTATRAEQAAQRALRRVQQAQEAAEAARQELDRLRRT